MHEAAMHEFNCFITLTYDEEHVPKNGSLVKKHFQDFVKRTRKKFSVLVPGKGKRKKRVYPRLRYFQCGEYGETNGRPHYHACLFGIDFPDKYKWRMSASGFTLYRSATLEELWKFGQSEIGEVTFESAAYCARYVMKKVTGDDAVAFYGDRLPEYTTQSLKPALGLEWILKYREEVLNNDFIVVNGKRSSVPRFYREVLEKLEDKRVAANLHKRVVKSNKRVKDSPFDARRGMAKVEVLQSRVKRLKREV